MYKQLLYLFFSTFASYFKTREPYIIWEIYIKYRPCCNSPITQPPNPARFLYASTENFQLLSSRSSFECVVSPDSPFYFLLEYAILFFPILWLVCLLALIWLAWLAFALLSYWSATREGGKIKIFFKHSRKESTATPIVVMASSPPLQHVVSAREIFFFFFLQDTSAIVHASRHSPSVVRPATLRLER